MAGTLDYVKICDSCPSGDGWGPSVTTETTLDGVPYAPFSKGDKLGRMADWTTEGKDRERGGRQQYNRNFRGVYNLRGILVDFSRQFLMLTHPAQTSKSTDPRTPSPLTLLPPRTNRPFPSSATSATLPSRDMDAVPSSPVVDAAPAAAPATTLAAAVLPVPASAKLVAARDTVATSVVDVVVAAAAAVASAGATTTSRLATATPASTSRPTGACWRRLTSTAWAS